MIPSEDTLMLHWKRSRWVLQMWQQANQSTMTLEPLQNRGWGLKENELTITWESDKKCTECASSCTFPSQRMQNKVETAH